MYPVAGVGFTHAGISVDSLIQQHNNIITQITQIAKKLEEVGSPLSTDGSRLDIHTSNGVTNTSIYLMKLQQIDALNSQVVALEASLQKEPSIDGNLVFFAHLRQLKQAIQNKRAELVRAAEERTAKANARFVDCILSRTVVPAVQQEETSFVTDDNEDLYYGIPPRTVDNADGNDITVYQITTKNPEKKLVKVEHFEDFTFEHREDSESPLKPEKQMLMSTITNIARLNIGLLGATHSTISRPQSQADEFDDLDDIYAGIS